MTQARILIVEDDNIIALELQDRLQVLGYAVAGIVASGEAAVAAALDLRPDLVLMDIRLRGGIDGVEAAGAIRARLDLPVIYVTAYADDRTLQRAKVTGPYGYIIKPFTERELRTAVETALYRHQMEARLQESERWLSTTLQSIGDAVIATDDQQRILFINPVAAALTGWTPAEALGQVVTRVFVAASPEELGAAAGWLARALDGGSVTHVDNGILEARDGRQLPIDATVAPIQAEAGPATGVVLVFRDVSERQQQAQERERLQAQLLQAQKMEALGILAGGIAHDFNNLMTTVIGYSSLALAGLDEQDALYRRLASIKWAGERASALTQQILALSKRDPAQPQVLDLNAVLGRLEQVLRRVLGDDIELILALEPGLACIEIDPVHIERILVSLVTNAYEAITGRGTVTVQTRNVRVGEERPAHLPAGGNERYVCLSVSDTGVGLDGDTRQHIFEPFFSTKDKGAGLGLSVAYGIVHQRGGWIEVASQPGQGATFRVYLPAVFENLADRAAAPALAPAAGVGRRVLLVEDEATVRAPVAEMLRGGGYEVVEAGSVEQARAVFAAEQGAFDLVFSDVSLPDGDGLQLVAGLQEARPGLKVLLGSGYVDRQAQWPAIRERGYRFLAKPYGLGDLLAAVQQAIAIE